MILLVDLGQLGSFSEWIETVELAEGTRECSVGVGGEKLHLTLVVGVRNDVPVDVVSLEHLPKSLMLSHPNS